MDAYICKVASLEELNERWDYLISIHPGDDSWREYKRRTIEYFQNGTEIPYVGILNGKIISEACAHIDKNCNYIENVEGLIDDNRAYLNAFRCNKEYEDKGYFSKLYHFIENDLRSRGYTSLSLGVEPCEIRNIQIYFHFGFTNYIKTSMESYLPEHEGDEPTKVYVNYYYKKI